MLPAGCGGRLAAALEAALRGGAERRRELERSAERGRDLLRGERRGDERAEAEAEAGPGGAHESTPSARELEELELLNAALEKALRVRKSVCRTAAAAQRAAGAKPASKEPASKEPASKEPASKEPASKEPAGGDVGELQVPATARAGPETACLPCEVRAGSEEPTAPRKPPRYRLRAPYRTDPDVRRTQRKASAGRVSRAPGAAGKSSSKAVASKQGRSCGPAGRAGSQEVRVAAEPQRTAGFPRSAPSERHGFPAGEGSSGAVCGQQLGAGKTRCGSLGLPGRAQEPTAGAGSTAPRAVTLREQGCQLELPHPYRKAHARNSRAWEKCRLCHTSADAAAARTRVTERIQSTVSFLRSPLPARWVRAVLPLGIAALASCLQCRLLGRSLCAAAPGPGCCGRGEVRALSCCWEMFLKLLLFEFRLPTPTLSPAEIEEELKALQDVPSRLSLCVEAECADHPTLQREYESLLTLEGLQSTVSQCLHKLQLLRAAVESQRRLHPDCTGDRGSCCAGCAPAGVRVCSSAGTLAAPLLWYSRLQELRDLFALKLQVSMLRQEIALQKLTMTELLPVLDSRPCPGASAAQLYRALYALLCEGGGRFPVLVRDELTD